MTLLGSLMPHLRESRSLAGTLDALAGGADFALAAPTLARPLVVAAAFAEHPRTVLVALPGEESAERFARQLLAYLPREKVLHLPLRCEMPWSEDASDPAVVGRRARALWSLAKGREVVVVASARALMRRVPPRDAQVFEPIALAVGAELDLTAAAERLARMGYARMDAAEEPGAFAVRGGVLDVFPADAAGPLRAELFGDEIESLRRYLPSTGQTLGDADPAEVFPCREVMLGTRAVQHAERALEQPAKTDDRLAHEIELMREGVYYNGVERHLPLFYREPGDVVGYLHPTALVVVAEPRALFDDAVRYSDEVAERAKSAGQRADGLFVKPAELDLGGRQRLTFLSLMRAGGAVDAELAARRPEVGGGEERFVSGLRTLLETGHRVVLAAPGRELRQRSVDALTAAGVSVDELGKDDASLAGRVVHLSHADVPAGFVLPDARLAVVSVEDAFPRAGTSRTASVDASQVTFDFAPGDHVVHATHGVALFRDVVRKEAGGVAGDYLALEYAAGDKLFVPVGQLDRVTKYVGSDGSAPRITRLNTADWSRATKKARAAARKLAFDLVDLYARRATAVGHAFSSDTPWQIEMEAMFPYVETPDQLAAIADVKSDMQSDRPMDRLICGDVGYGKTEVAIRAAFKAVQEGRQVMVLCPTTILAQQHHTTFTERFAPFPVRVDVLSRFRSKAEQTQTLKDFAAGQVDIIIGTHRLFSRDVSPKSLGLVIVDEEQRFGVQHKEHMKHLREQVDVLTLSATPIPRTLQMSLSGVRDMSVIDTPPPNRFPVKVHVGEYDPEVVSSAIRAEVERGGQVYYVSNRVHSIDDAVRRVQDAAPEARVVVAHGQMTERQLERVMESFAANEADVLVATTIIESGIDNPHSNTLVIEDSQRLGLAQLYQLKGRVGRSHVRAYAYFLFPRVDTLTDQAVDRLMAIRDHDDLGSGIKIALRDLEIRGAGTLLGAEQSGGLAAVGFDLYAQMIREAVAEARGEPTTERADIRVDLGISAFLPEDYVPDAAERVGWYRRIAGALTPEAVERVRGDLVEKHGAMPVEARDLLRIAGVRVSASEAGAGAVVAVRRRVEAWPLHIDDATRGRLAVRGAVWLAKERKLALPIEPGSDPLTAAEQMLGAILAGAQDRASG